MIERNEKGDFERIRCDVCGQPAPSTDNRIINHGLNGIGWNCTGGKHICPAATCQPPKAPDAAGWPTTWVGDGLASQPGAGGSAGPSEFIGTNWPAE